MIPRPLYLDKIRPFIGKDIVKVLTGVRRCGKSTILSFVVDELRSQGVSESNILMMNFESARWADAAASWNALYDAVVARLSTVEGTTFLLLDEVQEVPCWERAINALRVDLNCDIYITGSNARLLSTELSTLLTGRYVTIDVHPLAFRELVNASPDANPREVFDTYRLMGGMPFLASINYDREPCLTYLNDVLSSIVLKDIVRRHGVRNTEQLGHIVRYLISEAGTTLSVKNLAAVLGEEGMRTSRETIYSYLDAACKALLLSRVRRYDLKGKDTLRGEEKVYVVDHGFREALFGSNGMRIDLVLENIVYNDLLRRGFAVFVGRNAAKEVDFVAQRGGAAVYVQVAYLLASEQTVAREFGAFDGIIDNYPKYVVTMDEIDFSRNGIRHMNVRDFLLKEDLLG